MSVASAIVRTLLDCLDLSLEDTRAFLTDSGIDPSSLNDDYGRISFRQWSKLQLLALERSDDPACGLHLAEQTTIGAFSVLGYLFLNCQTAREALRQFFRYYQLLMDGPAPEFIEDGDHAKLIYHHNATHPHLSRFCSEYVLSCLFQIGNKFSANSGHVIAVGFQHPAPAYVDEYHRIFNCTVNFEQDSDYIIYDRASLEVPQLHSDAYLVQLLEKRAEEILRVWKNDQPLRGKIEKHLQSLEPFGKPNLNDVAKSLSLSARSLRRKLQEEGTTFSKVVDEVSAAIAKQRLSFTGDSIQEIAFNLGFSQASSFHRAFKRWTGITPAQFMNQNETVVLEEMSSFQAST
jgi:AraC-like DNA-binding protein